MAAFRLIASGIISFIFYAAWAWYANSLVSDDSAMLVKAALVQGGYSGSMTLIFTSMLEYLFKRYGASSLCLVFIAPRWSAHSEQDPCVTRTTFEHLLAYFEKKRIGIAGVLLVPLPALILQSIIVIAINIYFATPNLWLTVLPSMMFSALYGYSYTITLHRKSAT